MAKAARMAVFAHFHAVRVYPTFHLHRVQCLERGRQGQSDGIS